MRTLFNVIGTILSIGGLIAGVVMGYKTDNFGFCILEWLGVFLLIIIYFGIAAILKNQETIMDLLNNPSNNTPNTNISNSTNSKINSEKNNTKKASVPLAKEWKCPNCGKVNKKYSNICNCCGRIKP